ncbi:hypothetical protein U1Q18_032368 [Sarracenia purpurea var. burkii]
MREANNYWISENTIPITVQTVSRPLNIDPPKISAVILHCGTNSATQYGASTGFYFPNPILVSNPSITEPDFSTKSNPLLADMNSHTAAISSIMANKYTEQSLF